jgi:hypothetical protein
MKPQNQLLALSHTHTHQEAPTVNLGETFATAFAREAILGNFNQRLPLSVIQTKTDIFTPELVEHARKNRMIQPVHSNRSEKDPDMLIDKNIFSQAVDRVLSLWDKDNDPQVKFSALQNRYRHTLANGTFKSSGYVYLDEAVDGETINLIDVMALRRKFSSRIWIDRTSNGRVIMKLGER